MAQTKTPNGYLITHRAILTKRNYIKGENIYSRCTIRNAEYSNTIHDTLSTDCPVYEYEIQQNTMSPESAVGRRMKHKYRDKATYGCEQMTSV